MENVRKNAHSPAVRRVRLGVKTLSKVDADTADLCTCYGPATNAGSCCTRDHSPCPGGDERPVAWRGGGHPRMADLTRLSTRGSRVRRWAWGLTSPPGDHYQSGSTSSVVLVVSLVGSLPSRLLR